MNVLPDAVEPDPASRFEQGNRELKAQPEALRRDTSPQAGAGETADAQLTLPKRLLPTFSGKADEYV